MRVADALPRIVRAADANQCSAMSSASPMQKTIKGTRKWLSVRMALAFEEEFISVPSILA